MKHFHPFLAFVKSSNVRNMDDNESDFEQANHDCEWPEIKYLRILSMKKLKTQKAPEMHAETALLP